ncbi:MAG: GNAT family N-acetyltransferase [Symploca sp. SIO1B1]|nr:GNAT family N-acetyltransferase [Symploca sp. SIO1B1]
MKINLKSYKIQDANLDKLVQISALHKKEFSTHFLGHYSVNLISNFYVNFLGISIFIVAVNQGLVQGFLLGGNSRNLNLAKSQFIQKNKLHYTVETILRPQIYWQALNKIQSLYALKPTKTMESFEVDDRVRLLSLAVNDDLKGSGLASKLLTEFERAIAPVQEYGLSVKNSNTRAIKFYQKNGFVLEKQVDNSIYFLKRLVDIKSNSKDY